MYALGPARKRNRTRASLHTRLSEAFEWKDVHCEPPDGYDAGGATRRCAARRSVSIIKGKNVEGFGSRTVHSVRIGFAINSYIIFFHSATAAKDTRLRATVVATHSRWIGIFHCSRLAPPQGVGGPAFMPGGIRREQAQASFRSTRAARRRRTWTGTLAMIWYGAALICRMPRMPGLDSMATARRQKEVSADGPRSFHND